jgi:hypothetical protein
MHVVGNKLLLKTAMDMYIQPHIQTDMMLKIISNQDNTGYYLIVWNKKDTFRHIIPSKLTERSCYRLFTQRMERNNETVDLSPWIYKEDIKDEL